MTTGLESKKWWTKEPEDKIRQKYGKNCVISKPRRIEVKLPSGKSLTIEHTWYDILVRESLDPDSLLVPSYDDVLGAKNKGIHCIEIKFSQIGAEGSFGAFTMGEWIAAYLSLRKPAYSYEIYFVRHNKKNSVISIKDLQINRRVLDALLLYPQIKLYFYPAFLYDAQKSSDSELKKRKRINDVMARIFDDVNKTLKSLVEE